MDHESSKVSTDASTLESTSNPKKQRVIRSEVSSSPQNGVRLCSLKSCKKVINPYDTSRVEVKVGKIEGSNVDAFLSKCVVEWSKDSGEAQLHADCWTGLETTVKSKGHCSSNDRGMSTREKALVKEASKTAEWHDSELVVNQEAARIADMLKHSTYCIAFTGAGISTSAGIGDYRGKDGKWTEMDRKEKNELEPNEVDEGVSYESLRPTYTHEALVKLIEMGFVKHVISQNGDGLHRLSGIAPENLSELHGNVFLELCEKCGHRYLRSYYVMDDTASRYYEELEDFGRTSLRKPKHAKRCELCGLNHHTGRYCEQVQCNGFLKDSIINFRDNLEEHILLSAEMHARKADLCLSLGTTMQVTPACELVEMGQKPLRLVIVNRQKTGLDHVACRPLPQPDCHTISGSRVRGDTDCLMQAVMKHMLSESDLLGWEGRGERIRQYDAMRTSPKEML